jgi:glutaconate CoA-transferase subunit A
LRREKLLDAAAAVATIRDGETVALGGHSLRRHPMALVREIIRQQRRDLRIQGWNNGIDVDMLVGAGCAASVETSYVGLLMYGLAANFRRACEQGALEVIEHSETTALDMFRASAMGAPFLPTKAPLGSDVMRANPHITELRCPFTGEPYAAVRAARPDVALIHAHRADRFGNVQLDARQWPDNTADVAIAKAAKRVIVSVECIVEDGEICATAALTVLPRMFVTFVVEAPYGAHPCACDARYGWDAAELRRYAEASANGELFRRYLADRVFEAHDHAGYLARLSPNAGTDPGNTV